MEENRIGVAAIIIDNPDSVQEVNEALHKFSRLIIGRLGIPYRERGVAVISVVLDGTTEGRAKWRSPTRRAPTACT